jgi:hypothetical protein
MEKKLLNNNNQIKNKNKNNVITGIKFSFCILWLIYVFKYKSKRLPYYYQYENFKQEKIKKLFLYSAGGCFGINVLGNLFEIILNA